MRDYKYIDQYITKLYQDIYEQPEDAGHLRLAQRVVDYWMSRMTTCRTVLDVGAGQGMCQAMFEKWGAKYEGVALGEDVIKAQEKSRNVKLMDFNFLEYPDNHVDMIFARHSLEHSPMPLISLMEWGRVAKNWLGIVLPAPEWYTYVGQNHYSVMNWEQIHHLLDIAGWKVMWEDIKMLPPDKNFPENMLPHEYWIMSEKKRI
jgi:ubiquinone/menaquinone biosynthesis C-methylase UbiE